MCRNELEIARPGTREFRKSLEAAAGGWYNVTVRALDEAGAFAGEASVAKVGAGEVFVAASALGPTCCPVRGQEKTSTI